MFACSGSKDFEIRVSPVYPSLQPGAKPQKTPKHVKKAKQILKNDHASKHDKVEARKVVDEYNLKMKAKAIAFQDSQRLESHQ
jgi:hypothetical protein